MDFNSSVKWTIALDNGDDAPLRLDSVQLQMVERDLCFVAANGASYTLYYDDSPPRYDYASLFTLQIEAAQATAAPEQLNPVFQSRPDEHPLTEKHPALLWRMPFAVILYL